ncbi:MAG TPA: sugar ABC transporter ATP-binding protein, partial [Candidatus Pullichristensenella excrementigallinarum]|nr:sugar ABC transporter ATP-binding protein [Candidatus Pullichristensenella excrementigallinarum]
GAGKSTLMNVIGGVFPADSGTMTIHGQPYKPVTPKDARIAKIAFIHQELNLFSNLTVAENLYIDDLPKGKAGLVDYGYMRREAKKRLQELGMDISPRAVVDTLSLGVRQTVEIVKALIMDAEVILFDEPTTSLSTKEKERLFEIIRELKAKGVAVVFISHILEDVFELCDRVSVLRDGSLIETFDRSQLDKSTIISSMVGRKLENVYPTVEKEIGDVIFSARNLVSPPLVKDVSFDLRAGEILGVFGLMGAGRTETARAIYGADKMLSGTMTFLGEPFENPNPVKSIEKGMAFITEDRSKEGLLIPKPVEDNLILVKLKDIRKALGVISNREVDTLTDKSIKDLAIKVKDKRLQTASNLSGGNQQKVVIGKWLMKEPKMLLMDEPTRGVDVGAKYEIYSLIQLLAKHGSGILFISSEMEELMGVCDRIVVMKDGELMGEVVKGEYDQNQIMYLALGGGEKNA